MKFSKIISALLISFVKNQNLQELNNQVFQESKKFWKDQFYPWEEKGWTHEMIVGAKKVFWDGNFINKMSACHHT